MAGHHHRRCQNSQPLTGLIRRTAAGAAFSKKSVMRACNATLWLGGIRPDRRVSGSSRFDCTFTISTVRAESANPQLDIGISE
jgi:hypothetical protein